jgi:2'-hydroxyisoflavone reductase
MRLLVFGGSWFFGRLIVEDLARRGFDVIVFNEGRRAIPLPNSVRHILGDRECVDQLHKLAQLGPWDIVIDISGKVPAVVRRSIRALAEVAERYVFVSTIQAYRDWPHVPVDEDSPLWHCDPDYDPGTRIWNTDAYGPLKAGCEMACREAFDGDQLLILRLHTMVGRHEYSGPLRSWLERIRRGGLVLVPAPDRSIQAIDVRDVANFLVEQVQLNTHGVFNVGASTEGRTYGAMMRFCADVVDGDEVVTSSLVWIDEDWLVEQGVRQLTELPLWSKALAQWNVNVDRAVAAGLRCRLLINTIADVWRWLNSSGWPAEHKRSPGYGMDPTREAEIINRWRKQKFCM